MRKATSLTPDASIAGPLQDLLTLPEVAKILGISRPTVYTLIDNEGLPVVRLGNRNVRVVPRSLQLWIMKRERTW